MLLGTALRRRDDEHGAMVELEGALAAYERLGAALDIARVKELLGRVGTRRTFLFTDIVDSTKLLETLGDDKWRRLLARHDELIRDRIVDSGGEVIKKTGDGFFASFENPKAAVEAAIAIQRALAEEIVAPDVRIGAHAGEAFRTGADSSDYGGQGVHLAARIGAAASAGEILVSSETLDGAASSFRLGEPRAETLKGFAEPRSSSSPSTGVSEAARGRAPEEAQGPAAETERGAALVRRGREQAVVRPVRHEAHLDEDDRHVRPVEPREVGALVEPAVGEAERADELPLHASRRLACSRRRRRPSSLGEAWDRACGCHVSRDRWSRPRGCGGRAARRCDSRSGRARCSPCSCRRCACAS